MGLFFDAAVAWNDLRDTQYILDLGRKEKLSRIELSFCNDDFPHLAGMHYATDVDFKLREAQYHGARLVSVLLNKKMDDSIIEKSRDWNKISGRLRAIINLQNALDRDFAIALFDPKKVEGYCKIRAKFVIKDTEADEVFFVFLDEKSGKYYCKSAFKKEHTDYIKNQSTMTVLQKIKVVNGVTTVLFTHPNYIPK